MAEYIEREKLGIGRCNPEVFEDKGYAKGWNAAIDMIQSALAADVRPVVLCKDCKCYRQSSFIDKHMECARSRFPVHSVDFCSYGEKREES